MTGITRATRRLDLRSSKSATGYSFFRLLSGFVASTQRNSKEILLVSKKTIPLRVKADADVREVFWFAGRRFIGEGTPNQVFEWTATAGDYEITALDDHGRAGSHSIVVRGKTTFVWEKISLRGQPLNPNPRQTAS